MNEITTSDDQFIAARDFLRAAMSGIMPDLDFGNGTALNDLIITPAAKLAAEERVREDNYYKTYNPSQVTNETPPEVVDAILARYFMSPASGNKATGTLKIFASSPGTQIIPGGSIFTTGGLNFIVNNNVRAVASSSLVKTSQDVVYTQVNNGYYFLVAVTAEGIGAQYNIPGGSIFSIPTSYSSITAITASSDFSGGSDNETAVEAVGRIEERFGARTTGMASSLIKLVYDQFGITDAVAVYSPDPALLRASRNNVGMPVGGFCDLYVRSATRAEKVVTTLPGLLEVPADKKWSIAIPAEYNGLYQIRCNGVLLDLTNLTIDPSEDNTIVNIQDAVFTNRQVCNAVVYSADDTSALPVGTSRAFNVEITRMPLISDISSYLADETRKSGVDLLVRAVCPVFVTVSMTIMRKISDPVPDVPALKAALIAAVAELGIGMSTLDGSIFIGTIQSTLGQRSYVVSDSFTLEARVLDQKLGSSAIVGAKSVTVAERPEDGITKDTIGFILREENISINVVDY